MKRNKIAMFLLTIIVLGTLIYAYMDGGSPKAARQKRFDDTRVQNIQSVKNWVYSYYSKYHKLPDNLNDAKDNYSMRDVEKSIDPETNKEYEYQKVNEKDYKICATFGTNTIIDRSQIIPEYAHPAGHFCYTFSGDKY